MDERGCEMGAFGEADGLGNPTYDSGRKRWESGRVTTISRNVIDNLLIPAGDNNWFDVGMIEEKVARTSSAAEEERGRKESRYPNIINKLSRSAAGDNNNTFDVGMTKEDFKGELGATGATCRRLRWFAARQPAVGLRCLRSLRSPEWVTVR